MFIQLQEAALDEAPPLVSSNREGAKRPTRRLVSDGREGAKRPTRRCAPAREQELNREHECQRKSGREAPPFCEQSCPLTGFVCAKHVRTLKNTLDNL